LIEIGINLLFIILSTFILLRMIFALFAGADIPDPLQHLVEVVGPNIDSSLQAFFIHREVLDQILQGVGHKGELWHYLLKKSLKSG